MMRTIAVLLATTAVVATPLAAQQTVAGQKADPAFVSQLRAALNEHPEIVMEAAMHAQQQQRERQQQEQSAKLDAIRPTLFAKTAFGPTLGNPAGTKTVVELLDYACPFCKRSRDVVDRVIATDRDVRVVVVMRPVLGPESEVLARFALAADMQGKFVQAHEALYDKFGDDHQTHSTDDNLREVATKAGVDFDRAKRDMTSDTVEKKLQAHKDAGDKMQVNGTPFFATMQTVIPGAPTEAQLRAAIK